MAKVIKFKKPSSVLKGAKYDMARQDLILKFQNDTEYIYTPVSDNFLEKFKNASSKGRFFNKHIKDNLALTKLKILNG